MFPDAILDDFRYDFQRLRLLLELVVTQRDVVGQFRLLAERLHGVLKLFDAVFLGLTFVEDAAFVDPGVWLVGSRLLQQRSRQTGVVLLLLDHGLQGQTLLALAGVVDQLHHPQRIHLVAALLQRLRVLEPLIVVIRHYFHQLVLLQRTVCEVLQTIVTLCQQ